MTEIRDHFPELEAMDVMQLHQRRNELLASCGATKSLGLNGVNIATTDYNSMPDDVLAELLQVTRCLRRKAAAPGGAPKAKRSKQPVTLEDLA